MIDGGIIFNSKYFISNLSVMDPSEKENKYAINGNE